MDFGLAEYNALFRKFVALKNIPGEFSMAISYLFTYLLFRVIVRLVK